ncbi:hypothetical protein [Arthrobacter sp. H16F315]|uniref:hypothetical protein n=1 Tax=Arthrobacter sp. H16F315 TaxID=2955314 RepID=UPI002096E42F|nr:hypothetical protein [Arthrobacter sp. H16F315]MDD1477585.1 hypothetical protein [Arthrobacter sp. H16F315]
MSIDPRVALGALMAALEEHLAAASSQRRPGDPAVEAAFFTLADAFEVYDDALYEAYGEVTGLEVMDDGGAEDEDETDEEEDLEILQN